MSKLYDIRFDELFDEKRTFDGTFDKTTLISHKQSSKLYMKRNITNYDIKKFRNIYYKLLNMHYPCSFQPLFITNPNSSSNITPLILSSYLQNQSLKDAIQEININKKLDPTQKFIILYGILIFLQALHSDNYVHGRLKASNILLDSHFNPLVSDSFLYQLNTNNPLNESNKHMIDYIVSIPPEVLKNNSMNNYNDKSDIYSFGIILLQVFTQNVNVYSDVTNDPNAIINLIIKGKKPTIPDIDKKLKNIIDKCLDHDPEKRPAIKDIIGIIKKIVSDKKKYDAKRFHDFANDHQNVVKKLSKELTKIKKLADEGDKDMMLKYGFAMLNGENCEKDYNEGRKYIGKAAIEGLEEAQNQIYQMSSSLLIKTKVLSSRKYSLKDDPYFTRKKTDISKIIEKVKQIKKLITEKIIDESKFKNKGFVFTEGAIKRLTKIYYYLDDGVPVLLEGPTGTSKTLSSEIVCKLKGSILVRFNLSSDTKSNYLLGRYVGDSNSWAGITMKIGPFIEAYKNGYTLLLDEINLASQECIQFIEEALDSGVISVELPGMPLEEIKMHENFRLIATQNPNKGSFADKRYDLDNKFLSRFQVINFPSFEEDEYIKIAKGLCKSFKYEASDEFIEDLIKFHMKWSSRDDVKNDIQCFTVREIAATIHALSDKKNNVYDTIMTIYGARYSKDKKNELRKLFHSFNSFKPLKPSTFNYPEAFPKCYYNKNLAEALKSILFSFENNRHVILTAKEGYGITQVAKWVAQYYDQNKSKNKETSKNDTKYFCVCTEETKCSDLIGYQKPSERINLGQELIVWQNGFLTEAIKNGKCAVLDSLDEAPSTVAERLNALLDEKYDDKTKMFEIPENPQGESIKINPKFRLLCTCRLDNINQMSPAFINRFDVVVLENQLEEINNDQLKELIKLLMEDTTKFIPQVTNKKNDDDDDDIIDSGDDDYDFSLEEENKNDFLKKDSIFKKNPMKPIRIINKVLTLFDKKKDNFNNDHDNDHDNDDDYDSESDFSLEEENNEPQPINMPEQELSVNDDKEDNEPSSEIIDLIIKVFDNSITIYKLSQLCKAIKKFSEFFKDASSTISQSAIVEFARDLIINTESPENIQKVQKEIEDYLIAKLSGNKNEDNSFFFKESTSLCSFISKLYACSIINLPVCVYGPTGIGKTASARAFSCMRINDLKKTIPFRMHSFHVGTRPNNFYGSTTIRNGRVEFINGMLTESLQCGYTFIADEMNLSSSSTMKSLAPALEPCIGEIIYIPGVNEPIAIHPDFFFIACQNDVGTIGRNILPSTIASRLKTLYYPIQGEKEISLICKKIANSFYCKDDKKCFSDEDAEKIGKYMIMLNDKQKVIPKWSLRDITKIFKRVYYQDSNHDKYINIDLIHNILFYSLAPINSKDRKEILGTILDFICSIYGDSKREELIEIYNSKPTIEKKNGTFLMKGKIGISTQNLIQFDKYKTNFTCLRSLLDSIFLVLLSDPSEPILITGPSGFKTFLSQLFLDNPKVIALNQETTVSQLIGTSVFLSISEAKIFYLDQLCKICNIYDVKSLTDILKKGQMTEKIIKEETKDAKKEKLSFEYSINKLSKKLLHDNESYCEKSILSDMVIEFKPGQILSSIFEGKSIIFKDISNLPTVVLERFNELFSGDHNLTINEDYHNTFTSSKDKELKNFSTNFRAFATCPSNAETNLSEAALSRFSVINVPSYDHNELEDVLKSYNIIKNKKLPEDLTDKIIKFAKSAQKHMKDSLSFTQMINILDICSRTESSKYSPNEILGIVLYRIFGGLTSKRHKKIDKIKTIFHEIDLKFPEQITDPAEENPFIKTKRNEIEGIESKITGLFVSPIKNEKTALKVKYTKSFIDMIDIIHLGISSNVPVIFEGNSGQGKQTAIRLVAQMLGYDVINIIISKSTKVDDLLGKVTITNDEKNNINIKPIYTKLTKEIKYSSKINDKIFVFHNLNNASPAILEKLSSLFDRNQTDFSLPDGSTIHKGRINIIGIFNPQNGISNREKLPSSLIFSSIYHIVDNPTITDISSIINTLFNISDPNDPSSKNTKDLSQNSEEFFEKYCKTKYFALRNNAYPPITLHDINKFISFRSVTKEIFSKGLIYQMLFGYRFLHHETINNVLKELKLFDMIIQPIFNFDEKEKKVYIKESKSSLGICLEMNPNSNVNIDDIKKSLRTLTLSQKQCLMFLACSILSKRTCIIQGITASGKSHIIRFFANMLGKELIVYQMNPDTDISFLTGQSILSPKITEADSEEFKKAFEILNDFKELKEFVKKTFTDDFNEWKKENFFELLKEIDKYMKNNEYSKERLTIAKYKIKRTMSPARRFQKEDSAFIKALESGKWVLIDGIELAPPEIAEKLSSLCGDDMEIDFFECGENYYFSRKSDRKIHDNFHLFITYNPSSKTGTKAIDPLFLNKCVSFTIPALDSTPDSSSHILIGSLLNMNYDPEIAIDIGLRLATAHQYAKKDSETDKDSYAGDLQFTARTLKFVLKRFKHKSKDIDKTIYHALNLYYWNSYINKAKKKEFKSKMIEKLSEDPQKGNFITDITDVDLRKKYEILMFYLRNIQLSVCKKIEQDFNFIDFIEKCSKVQLADISFIKEHLSDTLNIIIENKGSVNSEKKLRLFENRYIQIQMILRIFNEISDDDKKNLMSSFYSNLPLIDENNILLSNNIFTKPISKLIFLSEINKESILCLSMPNKLYDNVLIELLKTIVEMSKNPTIEIFNSFIEKIHENMKYIPLIDDFFPYYLFKEYKNHKIVYWMPIFRQLYINKISFYIILNKKKYYFESDGYNNIQPFYAFNTESFPYLTNESMFQSLCKKKEKITFPKNISKDEKLNLDFYKYTKILLKNRNINISQMQRDLKTEKSDPSKVPNHYLFLSKFYHENINDSLVSRVWSIVYNFEEDKIHLLKSILHPLESKMLNLILNLFSNIDKHQIDELIDITKKLSQIGSKNTKLWLILNNEYPSIEKIPDIEKEMILLNNEIKILQTLPQIKNIWSSQEYIKCLRLKHNQLSDAHLAKLKDNKEKKIRFQLNKLVEDLESKEIKNDEYLYIKEEIVKLILNISEKSPDEKNYDLCEEKVRQFFNCLDKNAPKFSAFIWPNYLNESFLNKETPKIKLYNNVIWFSQVRVLLDRICNPKNNSPFDDIFELNKFPGMRNFVHLLMQQMMINKSTQKFNVESDIKSILYSMLNAHFINKLIDNQILEAIPTLDKIFNDLSLRKEVNKSEMQWIHEKVNQIEPTLNLVLPKFVPKDLLYLFIEYDENENNITNGPLIAHIKCKNEINNLFNDSKSFEYESFSDFADNIARSFLLFIFKDKSLPQLHTDLENKLKQKINELNKLPKKQNNNEETLKLLEKVQDVLNKSNIFDKLTNLYEFTNDDKDFLQKNWINNKDYIQKYPSLVYFLIKNQRTCSSLQNMFSNSQMKSTFLPFWLFALRIMSSLNCIVIDMDSSTETGKIISDTISKCIRDCLDQKKKKNIGTDWLNLVLSSLPSKIFDSNVNMFYDFFVYLSKDENKIKIDFSNKHKKEAIEQFTKNVCNMVFDKKTEIFLKKPFGNLTDANLNFINNPNQCINQRIKKYYENGLNDLLQKIDSKSENNKKIIENINQEIQILKTSIQNANELKKDEFLNSEKNVLKQNISKYNKLLKNLKSDNGEKIPEFSQSCQLLIGLYETIMIYELTSENNDSLAIYQLKCNKNSSLHFILPKAHWWNNYIKNNDIDLVYSKNEKYYVSQYIKDHCKIKAKKIKYEFISKTFPSINKNDNDIDVIFSNKIPRKIESKIPCLIFGEKRINEEELFKEIESICVSYLSLINETENDIKNKKITNSTFSRLQQYTKKIEDVSQSLTVKFNDGHACGSVDMDLDKIKSMINQLKANITKLKDLLKNDDCCNSNITANQDFFKNPYNLPYPKPYKFNSNMHKAISFDSVKSANFLSVPILFVEENPKSIACCYTELFCSIGPLIPSLYSEKLVMNFISFIDVPISIEVGIDDNITDNSISFLTKDCIQPGEPPQIEIALPTSPIENKLEFSIKANILIKSQNLNPLELKCNFDFKLAPLSILVICNEYKFSFSDDMIYLCAPQIPSNSTVSFIFQSFHVNEKLKIAHQLIDFDDNQAEKPDTEFIQDKNELKLKVKNVQDVTKLHCKLNIKFLESIVANILIESVIIPFEFGFDIYDYDKKYYTTNPTFYYSSEFIDQNIIVHCRLYASSFFSGLKATIKNNFNYPIKVIECPSELQIKNDTEFIIIIKMKNSYTYSLTYNVSVKILDKVKELSLKFEQKSVVNSNYKTNYLISDFNKIPVYGYNWAKNDWIKLQSYNDDSTDVLFIVSPFDIYNKIEKQRKITIPQFDIHGYFSQTCEIRNGKDNIFYLIDDKGKINEKVGMYYYYNDKLNKPFLGVLQNNWYPMFNEYPQYFSNLSKLEFKKINVEFANKNLNNMPKDTKPASFLSLAQLFANDFSVIQNLPDFFDKLPSNFHHDNMDELMEIVEQINFANEIEWTIPILKNNIIVIFYTLFQNRFNEIMNNKKFIPKIPDSLEIQNKRTQCFNEYTTKSNQEDFQEPYTDSYKKIKRIKKNLDNCTFHLQPTDQFESFLLKEQEKEIIPYSKDDVPSLMENSKTENSLSEKRFLISLPEINIPNESDLNELSIHELNQFYQTCTKATQLFPTYVKNTVNEGNSQDIDIAKEYFIKLLNIYNPLNTKDYSFISKSVNTFTHEFSSMIKKFENAGVKFNSLVERKIIITERNNQEFIQYPDKLTITIEKDDWKFKGKFQYNVSNYSNVIANPKSVSNSNPSNTRIDLVSIPITNDDTDTQKPSSGFIGNTDSDKKLTNAEIVHTLPSTNHSHLLFESSDESDSSDDNDQNDDENNQNRKIKVANPNGPKDETTIKPSNFDDLLSGFTEEDGINRAISLMENTDPDGEYENQSYNFHPFDENLYLKPDIDVQECEYPILSLIHQSFIISQEFIKTTSSIEIPYSTISANILIDCNKFINKVNKLYNMMIVCALTDALTTFGIPYSVSVIADSNFKCVIKPFSEGHSVMALQRICDCIMIDRFLADLPDCMRFAIDEMKFPNETRKNRAIFTFTNGLDENLVTKKQWLKIFNDTSLSFGFVFIKSEKLTGTKLSFLEQVWKDFQKNNEGYESFIKVSTIIADKNPIDSDGNISDTIKEIVNLFITVIKGKFPISSKNTSTENDYKQPIFELPKDFKVTNIYRFKKYVENKYKRLNNIFTKRTDALNNVKSNMDQLVSKHYNNNLNQVLSCEVDESIRRDFHVFINDHIQKKRKINMSSKEIVFKPNKASRLEPSSSGTVFDISALILYLINPVPEPMIYLEEKGGLIRNYGISVVIDISYSCFNPLSASHSFQTIMSILSALSTVDLPCFDLIIATDSEPIVVCSGVKTLYALNERSSVWNTLFAILQNSTANINRADLASGIHTAFDLRRMRSIQCTNILFVLTDGLYQLSEQSRIVNVVNNCVQSGINCFGVGIGIYPKGIENLFPQVVFAINPSYALRGISILCENYSGSLKEMPCIDFKFDENGIYDAIKDLINKENEPQFKSLKNELSQIAPTIRAFRYFIHLEDHDKNITPDLANPEGENKELYDKDFLKTQQILIIQLCDHTVCGDDQLNKDYIYKNYYEERNECINEAVKFFGISLTVVQNYEDAIHELTKSKTDFCDYYAAWIICSSHPEKMPESDKNTNKYLIEQFTDVLIQFWRNGGSLVFWADNDPYTFQVNVFLDRVTFENEESCKSGKVSFQIHGDDHPGGSLLNGDRTGNLQQNCLFNKKRQFFKELERSSLSNNLYHIFEGSTLSYVEGIGINEQEKILPFKPFAIDSNGGITSLFYTANLKTKTGDIIIDCGFSKLFYELTTEGTYRYIRNIAGWTARPEVHMIFDRNVKHWEWRPKAVHYEITYIDTPDYSQHVRSLISRSSNFHNMSVIKMNVKKLGGDIDCDLRFSIQWNDLGFWDRNDLDAHCIEPNGFEIMYDDMTSPDTEGTLDVDIINPEENVAACENIRWKSVKTMNDGTYRFFVHQFHFCGGTSGFRAEIEFNNRIFSYDYRKTLQQDEDVDVAYVTLSNGKFTIKHILSCK